MAKQAKSKLVVVPGHRAAKPPRCPECGRRTKHTGSRNQAHPKGEPCQFDDSRTTPPVAVAFRPKNKFGEVNTYLRPRVHVTAEVRAEQAKAAAAEVVAQGKRKAERNARRAARAAELTAWAAEHIKRGEDHDLANVEAAQLAEIEEQQRQQDAEVEARKQAAEAEAKAIVDQIIPITEAQVAEIINNDDTPFPVVELIPEAEAIKDTTEEVPASS
jgi:hypothetical protein